MSQAVSDANLSSNNYYIYVPKKENNFKKGKTTLNK
jgi:hypothetical protein